MGKRGKKTARHEENSEALRHSGTLSLRSTPVSEHGGRWGYRKVGRQLAKKAERERMPVLCVESELRGRQSMCLTVCGAASHKGGGS